MHLDEWASCLDAGPEKTNMFEPPYFRDYWGGGLSERGRLGLMAFKQTPFTTLEPIPTSRSVLQTKYVTSF